MDSRIKSEPARIRLQAERKRMKITQLFKIYWPDNGGGIAKVMESIADGFRDCEQEIIVCQGDRHKKSSSDSYKGVWICRCRQLFALASTPFSLEFLYEVRKRTRDSDFVIYHFPYPMADLAVLFGMYSGRLVVWWHCGFEKYKKLALLYRPLVEHTLQKADRILVSSVGNIENSDVLRKYRKKCRVIPFCVSDECLHRGRAHADTFYRKKERAHASETDGQQKKQLHASETDGRQEKQLHASETDGQQRKQLHASETDGQQRKQLHASETDGQQGKQLHVSETDGQYEQQGQIYTAEFCSNKKQTAQVNILFIGRLVWYKGCDILLKAYALMRRKDCRLALVGGGPLEQELKSLAASLKLKHVEFAGMVSEEEKMRRIEECDFLVLPSVSKAEAFAVVQLEAMAFGKPVINTKLKSGVPYVSIDGVTGRTVKPGSVTELAEAMEELAGDAKLRREYGENALRIVQEEYTQELMVERYRKVFRELLSDGKRTGNIYCK